MPSQPDFEYSYRWTEGLDAEKLDARDQALEAHMASFGGGCSVIFEYQYRWIDILAADTATQIQMLDANMTALEQAVSASGGCTLEFPFRWSDFWEALKAGESWAVGIAEENDRAIEFRFGRCTCGCSPETVITWTGSTFGGEFSDVSDNHNVPDAPIDSPSVSIDPFTISGFQSSDILRLEYNDGETFLVVYSLTVGADGDGLIAPGTFALSGPVFSFRWRFIAAEETPGRELSDLGICYTGSVTETLTW